MNAPQQQATFCTNKGYKVGCTITSYYYFNGQRVAMRKAGVVTWLHADPTGAFRMLGSASMTTDANGNKTSDPSTLRQAQGSGALHAVWRGALRLRCDAEGWALHRPGL